MNSEKLLGAIKMAGLQVNNSSKLTDIFVGKIINNNPVEIEVEQTNRISSEFLEISEKLTDRFVYMTAVEDNFENLQDQEKYKSRKKYILYDGLKVGEKVIVARKAGGQKYFVIDRVGK